MKQISYNYKLAFCISTYKRNKGLRQLLNSIQNSVLPNNFENSDIKVIVVDNFDGSSKEVIKDYLSGRFKMEWFHESRKGLTYARNKTISLAFDSEYCLFVDDDQIVDRNCVASLYETIVNNNADLAYGSNPPIYNNKAPNSIDKYFQPIFKEENDYSISFAPTNCTLIKKSILDEFKGPFDLTFNLTGGEDSFLTRQIALKGYKLYRSINAKAMEIVPDSRVSLRWVTKRHFRCSTSLTVQDKKLKLGLRFYLKRIAKAFVKIVIGGFLTPVTILFPSSSKYKYKYWIEAVEGAGHLIGYLNYQPKEYK